MTTTTPTTARLTAIDDSLFTIYCTGDACTGDTILFEEAVFAGSFRSPKFRGMRRIVATIENDSYGAAKQQHTFTLRVIASDGVEPLAPGTLTTRKGRNVYKNGTMRSEWADETARDRALAEKHERGARARAAREYRRSDCCA